MRLRFIQTLDLGIRKNDEVRPEKEPELPDVLRPPDSRGTDARTQRMKLASTPDAVKQKG
jgi:hypothetical protein